MNVSFTKQPKDTAINSFKEIVVLHTNSVFKYHTLKNENRLQPILHFKSQQYWIGYFLFLIFSVYVLIKVTDPQKILKICYSVFSLQIAKQLFREDYKLHKRVSVLLGFNFLLIMAFLVFKINTRFDLIFSETYSALQYFYFVVIVLAIYIIKFSINYVLSIITQTNDIAKEYTFNVFIFCQVIGIILFPLIVCMQFSSYPIEYFLYPSMTISLCFLGLRIARGFVITVMEQNIGLLYIFLYFCTLEILPLLILVKFLLINF